MTDESSSLTDRLLDEDKSKDEASEPLLPDTNHDASRDAEESLPIPATAETSWERGEIQPTKYRDWHFGVLFHLQFVTVFVMGIIYAKTLNSNNDDQQPNYDGNLDLTKIVLPTLVSAGTAIALIFLALVVLTRMGKSFITCSVWTSAIVSFIIGVAALSAGLVFLGVFSLFSALIGVCYAFAVRRRIPFAAANLAAGVSAIKQNAGITLVAFLLSFLLLAWMTLWTTSLVGVMNIQEVCDDNNECVVQAQTGGWAVPWVFFLFWTQQVFKNVIHTTIAGLVGTWVFDPEGASSFCSQAVTSSLLRSLSYSFGSICFGSLCVAILQTLDWMVNMLRSQREENGDRNVSMAFLLCCLDCILSLLQGIMEYFNKYAFVYVGVYGYPFMTAGKKVMTLFKERGWTVVINDNLISNALGLMCFVIALLSGLVPLAFIVDEEGGFKAAIFSIGFFVALLLSMTIMSIIDSAVTTIIVCFAEAPDAFDRNHNTHSRDMKEAWNKVYEITF